MSKYSVEELKQLKYQYQLLTELVGPIVHSDRDGVAISDILNEFFEDRDNTVMDAMQLAKMLASMLVAHSALVECMYYHEVERAYEQDLGSELN